MALLIYIFGVLKNKTLQPYALVNNDVVMNKIIYDLEKLQRARQL